MKESFEEIKQEFQTITLNGIEYNLIPKEISVGYIMNWYDKDMKVETIEEYLKRKFEEGNGKYEGLLGALHVSSACGKIKCKVGSGFTDEDRAELWVEHLAGRLAGKIATITYQEVTKDGSLRFPTFNHVRFDKHEADRF